VLAALFLPLAGTRRGNEIAVCRHAVLALIQPFHFLFLRHPQTHHGLDDAEENREAITQTTP